MSRLLTTILPILFFFSLSACMDAGSEVTKTATPSLTEIYYIKSADVAFHDAARINKMLRLNSPDSEMVAKQVKANVEHVLRNDLNIGFTGKVPAKLTVRIRSADVSSGTGRVLGSASYLTTDVTLSDAKTGQNIRVGTLKTEQIPFRGSGNIGIFVMIAKNAGTTEEKRYLELAQKFAADVLAWVQ